MEAREFWIAGEFIYRLSLFCFDHTQKLQILLIDKNPYLFVYSTGSGKWVVELSEIYPKSTFIGIDISISSAPNDSVIPLNAAFFECNIIDGLPFPNGTFDYVYQHNLMLAYTDMQWHDVLTELTRVIKPGGHLELVDLCFSDSKLSPTGNIISTSSEFFFIYIYLKSKTFFFLHLILIFFCS